MGNIKYVRCTKCNTVLKKDAHIIFEHLVIVHDDKEIAKKLERWSRMTEMALFKI